MSDDDGLYPDEPFGSEFETEEILQVEKGEGSGVVFAREAPLIVGNRQAKCSGDVDVLEKGSLGKEKKLSRQDRIELGRLFQNATSSQDWELSERMIDLADLQTLNDLLCISLDSIWFLSTEGELRGITGLIAKIMDVRENDRLVILMDLLGQSVRGRIHADQVSPLGAN